MMHPDPDRRGERSPSPTTLPHGSEAGALGAEHLGLGTLARLLEVSLDGIVVVDAERRYLYANPAACEILGYPPEQLLGRDFLMNFPVREHHAILERAAPSGIGRLGRWSAVVVRPDGEEREIEYSNMPFVVDGRPLVASIFRDVTEPRRVTREAAALAQTAARIAIAGSLDATLDALAYSVVRATRAVACSVVLIDEQTSMLRRAGAYGLPEGYTAAMEAAWRGGVQSRMLSAFKARRTELIRHARQMILSNPLYAPTHPFVREVPWDTIVVVPLVYQGRGLGAMNVYYVPSLEPRDDEIAFLNVIAGQAAIAVENARLVVEARGKAALEERQRLARALHDSVSQALYGIALGARTARALLDRDPACAAAPLEYVLSLAEAGLAEMRALIFELRPESLQEEGLVAALDKQTAALRARYKLAVRATLCDEPDVPLELKEVLYRIAQEALQNVVKHARATRVDLRLSCDPDSIALEVCDDGVGFDASEAFPGHLGLRALRERATAVGGTLEVASAPGQGACVRAHIPTPRST